MYDFVGEHVSVYILDFLSTISQIENRENDRFSQYIVQLEPWDFVLVFGFLDESMIRVSFQQRYPESGSLSIPAWSKIGYTVSLSAIKSAVIEAAEDVLCFAENAGDEKFVAEISDSISKIE